MQLFKGKCAPERNGNYHVSWRFACKILIAVRKSKMLPAFGHLICSNYLGKYF